jgi:hypothetical protein
MASVTGFNPAPSGHQPVDENGNAVPVGVWGDSETGVGVFGTSGTPSADLYLLDHAGVVGNCSMNGPGVAGASVYDAGVYGTAVSGDGVGGVSAQGMGVVGYSGKITPGWPSVYGLAGGYADQPGGIGVLGANNINGEGVVGGAFRGTGVRGTATNSGTGVLGEAYNGSATESGFCGVSGFSDAGTGVRGESEAANGMEGMTVGNGYGVYGLHFSPDAGSGVYGESVLGSGIEGYSFSRDPDVAAVRGQHVYTDGYAGLFVGNVKVTGAITKAGGGFRIDHPNDPQNKSLTHSFVESPEMLNVYSGTVTTDENGNARVALPDYFEALNGEFRYQLTTIGQYARVMVSEEVRDNVFAVQSDSPHVKVCWQVTGVRRDRWAEANRIQVEQEKPAAERGGYLHPELFPHKTTSQPSNRRPADTVTAVLPDQLRRRADEVLSGSPERTDVYELITEVRHWLAQRAAAGRSRAEKEGQMATEVMHRLLPNQR